MKPRRLLSLDIVERSSARLRHFMPESGKKSGSGEKDYPCWLNVCVRTWCHLGTTKGFLYFWLSRLLAISVRSKSMCMAVYDAPPSVAEASNPQALALCHSITPTPSHLLSPALAFSGIIKAFKWFSGSRKAQLKAVTTVAVGLSAPNGIFVMIDSTLVI
jgi:hypothetical protein